MRNIKEGSLRIGSPVVVLPMTESGLVMLQGGGALRAPRGIIAPLYRDGSEGALFLPAYTDTPEHPKATALRIAERVGVKLDDPESLEHIMTVSDDSIEVPVFVGLGKAVGSGDGTEIGHTVIPVDQALAGMYGRYVLDPTTRKALHEIQSQTRRRG